MSYFVFYAIGVLLLITSCRGTELSNFTETDSGCNVTLLCLHAPLGLNSSVVWIHGSSAQVMPGSRLKVSTFGFFSTLTILAATPRDNGFYTCVTPHQNTSASLKVRECTDKHSGCKRTVEQEGKKYCKGSWMKINCRFSCELCPKRNCSRTELPAFPEEITPTASEKPTKPQRTSTPMAVSPRPSESVLQTSSNALSVQTSKSVYLDFFLAVQFLRIVAVVVCYAI